jgi:hypothetical protein
MSNLVGTYRHTNEKVSTIDDVGRENGIKVLKEIFDWDLISNTKKFKIDLLHVNRRGGCDVEEGKWKGFYRDQDPSNFNKFTLPFPTANFPARKEKYFNEYFDSITDTGNLKTYHHPDYEYNSLLRFNFDFTEFFFVDYNTYKKKMNGLGLWAPDTVFKINEDGIKTPENWMCWELKDVDFYYLENGVWKKDNTFQNPTTYDEYILKYKKSREKFLNKKNN